MSFLFTVVDNADVCVSSSQSSPAGLASCLQKRDLSFLIQVKILELLLQYKCTANASNHFLQTQIHVHTSAQSLH